MRFVDPKIVKNLLATKVAITIISQGTELNIEEIKEIQRRESIV